MSSEEPSGPPPNAVYTIRDLAQLKVLADPFRVRILEAFCEEPRTTKQVAELLGEKPTKLYHHVDSLLGAELIELVSTRPVRGTLEKTYRGVARTFAADPSIFSSGPSAPEENWTTYAADLLERGAAEIRALADVPHDDLPVIPMLLGLKASSSPEAYRRFQEALQKLVADLQAEADAEEAEGTADSLVEYRMVLALFPQVES